MFCKLIAWGVIMFTVSSSLCAMFPAGGHGHGSGNSGSSSTSGGVTGSGSSNSGNSQGST